MDAIIATEIAGKLLKLFRKHQGVRGNTGCMGEACQCDACQADMAMAVRDIVEEGKFFIVRKEDVTAALEKLTHQGIFQN